VSEELSNDWLRPEAFDCPKCGVRLFRVDHSPFCDDYRLYCDGCPRAIEVSFYDPVLAAAQKGQPDGNARERLMNAIEPLLRPCVCGGRYRDRAARRCFRCNSAVIVEEAAGIDLLPYVGCEDQNRDPTDDEIERHEAFEREYVRTTELWA
jgi:hypothetical protein